MLWLTQPVLAVPRETLSWERAGDTSRVEKKMVGMKWVTKKWFSPSRTGARETWQRSSPGEKYITVFIVLFVSLQKTEVKSFLISSDYLTILFELMSKNFLQRGWKERRHKQQNGKGLEPDSLLELLNSRKHKINRILCQRHLRENFENHKSFDNH